MNAAVRRFDSGATRDLDQHKLDFEAFLCPLVLERYAQYMHKYRVLPDGSLRPGDNWQLGIPAEAYVKSLIRHTTDVWKEHRGYNTSSGMEDALCAVIFNASGRLHELLKAKLAPSAEASIHPGSADAAVAALLPPGSAPGEE